VLEFIAGRLRVWFEEQDWPRDVISAVLAAQSANPYRALIGIQELVEWVKRPDWASVLDNFARCVRITRAETARYEVDPARLAEPQEKALWSAYQDACTHLDNQGNVDAFLKAFVPVVPAVAAFFDKVLVHSDDQALRQNRLGLLQAISAMQSGRADLSYLSGF
jgi:glycyl-tRNA synthetase beta subunit